MKKQMRYIFYLAIACIWLAVPAQAVRADSEYNYSKDNTAAYNAEEVFTISENLVISDFFNKPVYFSVKEIRIKEGVTSFDWDILATGYFPNLETVTLPSTLKKISYNGFNYSDGLSKLRAVTVAKGNTSYVSVNGCLFNKSKTLLLQYPAASENTSYVIPDTVTKIKSNAFVHADKLQTVTIGAKVDRSQLKSIMNQLRHINGFKVNSRNTSFSAKDGVLFDKKGATLLLYPNGKGTVYSVPKGTTALLKNSFYNSRIKKLTLPSGLKSINKGALSTCNELTTITIPKALTKMDVIDIKNLKSLQTISVESGNKLYKSYKGILYNRALTKIIFVPQAYSKSSLLFPSTLQSLDLSDFSMKNAREIKIPRDLKTFFSYNQSDMCFSRIVLENGNKKFILHRGSLYNKEKTELSLFLKQEKAEFPDTLKSLPIRLIINGGIKELVIPPKADIAGGTLNIYDIPTLKKVTLSKGNKLYTLENGMLLSADKSTLYDIPQDTKNLILPDSVRKIEMMLFYNRDLTSIKIPKSLTDMRIFELRYIKSLESIEVDPDNSKYASRDGVLYNKELTELLYYPVKKQSEAYTMPDTVKTIYDSFSMIRNPYLEELTLSKELEYKDYNFTGSSSLKEIQVSQGSTSYKSMDGVLYNSAGTELIAYPYQKSDKSFTIPDTVISVKGLYNAEPVSINEYSYYFEPHTNPHLETLTIGKNVKEFFRIYYDNPVWGFENLKKIIVSDENQNFKMDNGILYSKDGTVMYLCTDEYQNPVLTIPATVTKIPTIFYQTLVRSGKVKGIEVEAGNTSFRMESQSLYNYLGNLKYFTVGDTEYPRDIVYD